MESADHHYKAIEEGIMRPKFIRQDLAKTLTEYNPEKVRGQLPNENTNKITIMYNAKIKSWLNNSIASPFRWPKSE